MKFPDLDSIHGWDDTTDGWPPRFHLVSYRSLTPLLAPVLAAFVLVSVLVLAASPVH